MNKKEKGRGYLFIVGGPGGSGSSTISKMLAKYFHLKRVYAGQIFRDIVGELGYDNFEDFYTPSNHEKLLKIDREVDAKLLGMLSRKNILLESKILSAIVTKKKIPCTVKIWIDASLHVRTFRHLKVKTSWDFFKKTFKYISERIDLRKRYLMDWKRYFLLYGVDYSKPELYNDIVIDSSDLNEEETFSLILKLLKDGGYIREEGRVKGE